MSRNVEENVYVTIAFARDSETWQDLRREASDLDISVAHLIKVLLGDRTQALQGHGKHLWFPRAGAPGQAASTPVSLPEQALQAEEGKSSRRAAASAALYWNE